MPKFIRSAKDGRVFAKAVGGKLLFAHKITVNSQDALNSWIEYPSLKQAAEALGVPILETTGCPIIDKTHPPIEWREYKGGYYIK